jgi:Tfp pilus assembly protein PilV
MSKLSLLRARRRGFSLVEVLIGMVILMLALASAAALSISNARLVAANQFRAEAASLAEWKLEQLRNTTYSTIGNGTDADTLASDGSSPGPYTRSWTVISGSPRAGLKTVIVTVNWTQFGSTHSYRLSGVIGQ